MNITKKSPENGAQEITVAVSFEDFKKYFDRAAEVVSKDMKVEGFRPGKVPFDILRARVGDMVVLEEAARQLIMKEADDIIGKEAEGTVVGQPQISITKLAYGEELEFKISCDFLPEVKLANYKNRGLKQEETKVSDEEIDKILVDLAESRAKEALVDRAIQDGDKALVDIKMFLDNVPVDGGQSKGVAIILGKGFVVPGFDKELIGASKGETKEFSLVFPTDHYQKNLAGKKVEFNVEIKEIYSREMPAFDDEFAQGFGIDNMETMKKNIRENMEHEQSHKNTEKAELELIEILINESEFGTVPGALIAAEKELMVRELKQNIESYGGKFEDYLASIKKTVADMMNDFTEDAIKRVKSAVLMRKIIEVENIKPEEKDIDHEISHLLEHYGADANAAKRIKSTEYRANVANNLAIRQAVEKLCEWNIANRHICEHKH